MSVDLDADLAELRDAARQVLGEEGRAAVEVKTWPLVVELGWLLVAVPEADGGLGQGARGAAAFHTELGRSLCAAPFAAAMLGIEALVASRDAGRTEWIERAAAGALITASLAGVGTLQVQPHGAAFRINGTLAAVASADRATDVLVSSTDGRCVACVPLTQRGITFTPRPTWDTTRRLFDLRFVEVEIDASRILAQGESALALQRRLLTSRDFALAADAVGGAAAALEMTVEYLQTRRQFGRPLALFQALKHRCADLKAQVVAAEALLADSLRRSGDDLAGNSAALLAKGAKALACAAYARVAEEALQLHGGIGMTSEHPCHLFLKRALLNEQLGSASGDQYSIEIADAFLATSA